MLSRLKNIFEIEQVADIVLRDSITGNVKFFSYFFKRLLDFLIAGLFCFLIALNFYTSFINYIVIFYKGYILGLTVAMCVALFGVGGAVTIIIFYVPFQLALNFVLICFASILMENALNKHRYKNCYKIDYSFLVIYLILILVLCLLEAIFLPPMLKSIIYVS